MRGVGKPALPTDELKVTTDELLKAPPGSLAKLGRITCLVATTYGPEKSSKRGSNSASMLYIKRANICQSKPLRCARILLLWSGMECVHRSADFLLQGGSCEPIQVSLEFPRCRENRRRAYRSCRRSLHHSARDLGDRAREQGPGPGSHGRRHFVAGLGPGEYQSFARGHLGNQVHHQSEAEASVRDLARPEDEVRADDLGQAERAQNATRPDLSRDDRVGVQSDGEVASGSRWTVAVHQ